MISVIGERLAEVRKDHGDTQQSFAMKMNVTKYTVSSWEQEKSEPNHEMLVKICRLYGISSDYLLGLSNVDPAYIRSKAENLSADEFSLLKDIEEFFLEGSFEQVPFRILSVSSQTALLPCHHTADIVK